MPLTSAGLLLYRQDGSRTEVFLIHPGGPFWARKDEGAWSVPKGLLLPGEDPLHAAWREFREETGFNLQPVATERDLGSFRLSSGKQLRIWAIEGNCDPATLQSNLFDLEWPPKSGQMKQFPEADRGDWFDEKQALVKISRGQRPVIEKFFADLR
jgi:predicted NUDIX family NTP pyrophosphohydrolase